MADELNLKWGLQPDKTHLTLAIFRGGKIMAQIDLPPASVMLAVRGLAQLRTEMIQPEGQSEPEGTSASVLNPLWLIREEKRPEGSELVLQHPGFGVLSFVFPPAEVEKIVEALTAHIDSPAGAPQAKPN
ncbi:MAG: hypothetical protein HYR63_08045 [Proteobacteria bacterium]|nr:hypothetical protein [Pseudomonadota bacterium]MBI3499784.1 hypothetical protein [Pseudomonadota bacterium]